MTPVLRGLVGVLLGRPAAGTIKFPGTHRSVSSNQTLERVMPIGRSLGITRVANVTHLDRIGIPTVMVVRPAATTLSVWQGKGASLADAKVSGIMEAIETALAERDPAVEQIAGIDEVSTGDGDDVRLVELVPAGIRREQLGWATGYDLINQRTVRFPSEILRLGRSSWGGPGHFGTNGLAAGNNAIEATLHAIYELVERDAWALWNLRPLPAQLATRIDPLTVGDRRCAEALTSIAAAGIDAAIYDMSSDVGIPAFLAVLEDESLGESAIGRSQGSGCHAVAEVALFRAVSEAAQSRLTTIVGARDDLPAIRYSLKRILRLMQPPLSDGSIGIEFPASTSFQTEDLGVELRWVLEKLRSVGVTSVIVADLAPPSVDISVVRVMIGELENYPFARPYEPGPRAKRLAQQPK